ncbi:uridine cytidine kinase 1 1 [Trichuris trichiura]|uniref:uridine/cytidine kinase n=1 Tax=Trichuris trichiura TaxID=36087 RepID=A0A077Z2X0_TRITR|nr:uridine cytidine kinase 1 1 [Trichuris trichiura]
MDELISVRSGSSSSNRSRTFSGSKSEDHVVRWNGKVFYTAGRPPWYDCTGAKLRKPFIIGIAGGSASGKTTVANRIIESLDIQWVTLLSMDSFYNVLSNRQHEAAAQNRYNFDHPDAFDFELLQRTLMRLKEGKRVVVCMPDNCVLFLQNKIMYGASVLIFEGILAFHKREIMDIMDLKIFVDTDADTRLARRLQRDILERGRDINGVLDQYTSFVKPAFDSFIAPTMRYADIIIPRGGSNLVAIDLIVKHIKTRLLEHDCKNRAALANGQLLSCNGSLPPSLHLLKQGPQIRGLHALIRNRKATRCEFIFYSNRLMRLLIEHSLSLLPFEECIVETPQGTRYRGKRRKEKRICGISILRAGETMETALREVVKDCIISKILIQTNPQTLEPELYYLTLPKDIHLYQILLMDATVATGAAAMMAIRILLDHDVPEENITLMALLMAEGGVQSVAYAFPKVRLVTTAVDDRLSPNYHILPGIGNFGDRYFGTEMSSISNENNIGVASEDEN